MTRATGCLVPNSTPKLMKPNYKRMVKGMQENVCPEDEASEPWYLYILLCSNGTFYTGVTKDLKRRLAQHNAGSASKYTRTRRPVKIIYQEKYDSRAEALARECKIKAMSRKAKEKLIKTWNILV